MARKVNSIRELEEYLQRNKRREEEKEARREIKEERTSNTWRSYSSFVATKTRGNDLRREMEESSRRLKDDLERSNKKLAESSKRLKETFEKSNKTLKEAMESMNMIFREGMKKISETMFGEFEQVMVATLKTSFEVATTHGQVEEQRVEDHAALHGEVADVILDQQYELVVVED